MAGRLDGDGLDRLQTSVDDRLDGGARRLVVDLSAVASCDSRLFDLLSQTSDLIGRRGGWLRLVGVGPPVLNTLDQAALPEILLVYRASGWASQGSAEPRRGATSHRHGPMAPAFAQPGALGSPR